MTLSLGRFAMAYAPLRLPPHPRRTTTSSIRLRPRLTQRGGRNLGLRYQQFESFIRNTARKAALLDKITETSRSIEKCNSTLFHDRPRVLREETEIFHGLVVPKVPKTPESDECCMSGCAVCVYDLYEDSLLEYKASLVSLQRQLKSMGIPESEWPSHIKSSPNFQAIRIPSSTSLDAFEAMEKALKAKQQGRAQGGS